VSVTEEVRSQLRVYKRVDKSTEWNYRKEKKKRKKEPKTPKSQNENLENSQMIIKLSIFRTSLQNVYT